MKDTFYTTQKPKPETYARGLTQNEYQKEQKRRKNWHKEFASDLCMQGWGSYATDTVDFEFVYAILEAADPHTLEDPITHHQESEEVFVRRLKEAFDADAWGAKMRQRNRRPVNNEDDFAYPSPT